MPFNKTSNLQLLTQWAAWQLSMCEWMTVGCNEGECERVCTDERDCECMIKWVSKLTMLQRGHWFKENPYVYCDIHQQHQLNVNSFFFVSDQQFASSWVGYKHSKQHQKDPVLRWGEEEVATKKGEQIKKKGQPVRQRVDSLHGGDVTASSNTQNIG